MPFEAQTYFPTAVAGEGVNNRKIDTTAPAASSTTTCVFGTTTTVRFILAKPTVANSATLTPIAGQDFGWNILKLDMNNTASTPNKRLIPAGSWVFRGQLTPSTADTLSASYGLKIYVHRRSGTGVLTELFNVTSTFVGISLTPLAVSVTKTGVAEVVLALDETIHVEYWMQGRGGGATGILAQTVSFDLGATVDIVVPTLGIRTQFSRSLITSLIGVATRILNVKPVAKVAALIGISSDTNYTRLIPKIATMIGLPASIKNTKPIAKLATMAGVATRILTVGLFPKLATMIGVAAISKYIKPAVKVASMAGVASINRYTLLAAKVASMVGNASTLRYVRPIVKLASMIGVSSSNNYVRLSAKLASMVGVVSSANYVRLVEKVSTMLGVTTLTKSLILTRYFLATMIGVTGFNRAIIAVRYFLSTMLGVTLTYMQIPQTALNRITGGGGTTVIRKIFGVFD